MHRRFQIEMQEAEIVRQVLEIAGLDHSALVELHAVSEKQKNFAGFIRISALADVWQNIKKDYQTPEFAKIIIVAVNRHKEAKWWCEHELDRVVPKAFLMTLRADIKAEQEKAKGAK